MRRQLNAIFQTNVIAVMLTGMDHDGNEAFAELKRLGARTIAESE